MKSKSRPGIFLLMKTLKVFESSHHFAFFCATDSLSDPDDWKHTILRSWTEENVPAISCLYYAVTVVCTDGNNNEVEHKKVKVAPPMVVVTQVIESGDAIALNAKANSGRPGHPAV